jgi:glyoxylase-like metal-dependent hydrolase (beta-lactamase superfamily II)
MTAQPYHILDLHYQGLPDVIAVFLIPTSDGPVLVESGPHSCWPALVSALARHGFAPEDIRHVLLTHIHLDHAGAAWALARAGATIHVHPAGLPHLLDPSRLMDSARRIYQDQMDVLWGEMHPIPAHQVLPAGDQMALQIGDIRFIAHHTPGHAIHHIAWQMADRLFTGDVAGIHIGSGPVAPPCPPPEFDLEAWLTSIQHIRSLPLRELILTHYGAVHDIAAHLDDLESALRQWVAFFETQEDLTPGDDLTARFLDFIHREFYPPEMGPLLRDQYDKANPPWMSVAGITRYLRRKRG